MLKLGWTWLVLISSAFCIVLNCFELLSSMAPKNAGSCSLSIWGADPFISQVLWSFSHYCCSRCDVDISLLVKLRHFIEECIAGLCLVDRVGHWLTSISIWLSRGILVVFQCWMRILKFVWFGMWLRVVSCKKGLHTFKGMLGYCMKDNNEAFEFCITMRLIQPKIWMMVSWSMQNLGRLDWTTRWVYLIATSCKGLTSGPSFVWRSIWVLPVRGIYITCVRVANVTQIQHEWCVWDLWIWMWGVGLPFGRSWWIQMILKWKTSTMCSSTHYLGLFQLANHGTWSWRQKESHQQWFPWR